MLIDDVGLLKGGVDLRYGYMGWICKISTPTLKL